MKYAFNNNGILQDVIQTPPSIIFPESYASQFIEVPDEALSGWAWNGVTAIAPPTDTTILIPQSVKMRQARLALHQAGLLETVESNVQLLDKPAQIEWEFAETVERASPLVTTLATLLNMTEEQVDSLFTTAATL